VFDSYDCFVVICLILHKLLYIQFRRTSKQYRVKDNSRYRRTRDAKSKKNDNKIKEDLWINVIREVKRPPEGKAWKNETRKEQKRKKQNENLRIREC
jgi:hypothetical protein